MRLLRKHLAAAMLLAAALPAAAQEPVRWVFEGVITQADPALAPDLQSGWVLAGSFDFAVLEMEEEPVEAPVRGGRLAGGVSGTELTVDLYYQLHYSATQAAGLAGFDYRENDPEADGRDLVGWFFPLEGRLKETGWSCRWLQVWLADPEGKMLVTAPPRIPPNGLEWKAAWFRMTFRNTDGRTVHADGRIDIFCPQSQLKDDGGWEGMVAKLGNQLLERDATVSRLSTELDQTRERMEGLRRMVDLLVEERARLQDDVSRLSEQAKLVDPAVQTQLAELTAGKAVLESELGDLAGQNRILADLLAKSENERAELMARLRELEAAQQPAAADMPPAVMAPGTMVIVEQPLVIEEPPTPLPGETAPPAAATLQPWPAARPAVEVRRWGPRKFR